MIVRNIYKQAHLSASGHACSGLLLHQNQNTKPFTSVSSKTPIHYQKQQPFATLPNFTSVSEDSEKYYATSETTNTLSEWDAKTSQQKWTPQLTKIVATIGPTSEQLDVLQEIVRAGMRIMRLNFSHATVEEVELRSKNLKQCKGIHSKSFATDRLSDSLNLRATLLDTRGPEIRTGKLRNDHSGHETISLIANEKINLHTSVQWKESGSTELDLFIDYEKLHQSVDVGNKILLDDGAVILTVSKVTGKDKVDGIVECTIDNSGELRSRAGVNVPGVETDLPAITEKDKNDIRYGLTKDIDYIAASFIQNAEGVRQIKRFVRDTMMEDLHMDKTAPAPLIISKIESVAALRNFDEILKESDGIMVARGDLGVEIPIQQVTSAQKEMMSACIAAGKPVIVATQMLESMAKNPRPTRAEVADVTNAVYDGADCVMLSGESAKGKYPVDTVKMMNEIILGSERFHRAKPEITGGGAINAALAQMDDNVDATKDASFRALAKSAVVAAEETNACAIILATTQYRLPQLVSSYRPNLPIITFCPSEKVGRQLQIYRGLHPVIGLQGTSEHNLTGAAIKDAKAMGLVEEGDKVVIISLDFEDTDLGTSAVMKIATVPSEE